MELVEYADVDMMMLSLAQRIRRELSDALLRRERAVFSVPGGTTPGPLFDLLAAADLEWDRIDILPGDERWVPEDHPRSNAGQIRARLLQGKARQALLVSLWRPVASPADGAPLVDADVAPRLPIDVAIVGMGTDWHTASLFPGAAMLSQAMAADAPSVLAISAPGATEDRITLSAAALNGAFNLHVLITGTQKRDLIEQAEGMDPMQAPIAALLGNATVHWARD